MVEMKYVGNCMYNQGFVFEIRFPENQVMKI